MNRKKEFDAARNQLMLLQDKLFELHNRVQDMRQHRRINSTSLSNAPIHALAQALQEATSLDRTLQLIELEFPGRGETSSSSGKGGDA